MTVLALSDIHGHHGIYRRLPDLARRHGADVVVLAGDLLGARPGFERIEDAQWADAREILVLLAQVRPPILYVMGNDDMIELDPERPGIRSIHGRRVRIADFNFVGYQYSLPFMGGIFERTEAEIAADIAVLEPLMDERTVFVTHNPAFGMRDTLGDGTHVGSTAILHAIQSRRVRAHIHGHVHAEFGREGIHFNAASGGRRVRGIVIHLATMAHEIVDEGELAWESAELR